MGGWYLVVGVDVVEHEVARVEGHGHDVLLLRALEHTHSHTPHQVRTASMGRQSSKPAQGAREPSFLLLSLLLSGWLSVRLTWNRPLMRSIPDISVRWLGSVAVA